MVAQPSLHGLFALRFSLQGIIGKNKDSKEQCQKDPTMILAIIRSELCEIALKESLIADA